MLIRGISAFLSMTFFFGISMLSGCTSKITNEEPVPEMPQSTSEMANVISVQTSGSENNYQFSVGVKSPDVDCELYANWWEIISTEGSLIYRRILTHSHPSEQPFTRSGGPVQIGATEEVIVRAHMHPTGYGGTTYQGSVSTGFRAVQPSGEFASGLSNQDPLPTVCTS